MEFNLGEAEVREKGGGLQGQNVRLEREAKFPGNTIPECAIGSGGKDRMCIRATQEARAQSQDTEQDAELGKRYKLRQVPFQTCLRTLTCTLIVMPRKRRRPVSALP